MAKTFPGLKIPNIYEKNGSHVKSRLMNHHPDSIFVCTWKPVSGKGPSSVQMWAKLFHPGVHQFLK